MNIGVQCLASCSLTLPLAPGKCPEGGREWKHIGASGPVFLCFRRFCKRDGDVCGVRRMRDCGSKGLQRPQILIVDA